MLEDLRVKLNSEMPPRKKVSLAKKKTPKIKPNEIYYFKLDAPEYQDKFYYNMYVLILVDSWEEYDIWYGLGDELPLVYLLLCRDLPSRPEDIDGMDFFSIDYMEFKDDIHDQEKRILINYDGFMKFRNKLTFLYEYDFKRDENNKGVYHKADESYRPIRKLDNQTGKMLWVGIQNQWYTLERDVVFLLNHPGAERLVSK